MGAERWGGGGVDQDFIDITQCDHHSNWSVS